MTEQQKNFGELIADVNKILTDDAKKIGGLINFYKKNPINSPTEISMEIFDKVVPFTESYKDDTKIKKALCNQPGVYIFLMTSDCNVSEKFNSVYYGAPLKDATISKFKAGNILYVGKAKSILNRMGQHFNVANENNHTGSLKILSPERINLVDHFKVYAFCIKSDYKDYYDIIASAVESVLREGLKPLVGI